MIKKDWKKEFRFYYSAPLVDLSNKEKPTLGDINEILVKQIAFIRSLLKSQKQELKKKVEKMKYDTEGTLLDVYQEQFEDGFNEAVKRFLTLLEE